MPKNVGDLGELIVAKGFEKLPKVLIIAQSGNTGLTNLTLNGNITFLWRLLQSISFEQKVSWKPFVEFGQKKKATVQLQSNVN